MRGLAYNRKKSFTKAKRKQNICEHYYGWEYYDNLHQYSKNKIHCSCPLCRAKTGKHKMIWGTDGKNWKISDLRKINQMEWDSKNWEQENNFVTPREDTYEDWWLNDNLENLIMSIEEEGVKNE